MRHIVCEQGIADNTFFHILFDGFKRISSFINWYYFCLYLNFCEYFFFSFINFNFFLIPTKIKRLSSCFTNHNIDFARYVKFLRNKRRQRICNLNNPILNHSILSNCHPKLFTFRFPLPSNIHWVCCDVTTIHTNNGSIVQRLLTLLCFGSGISSFLFFGISSFLFFGYSFIQNIIKCIFFCFFRI